VDQRYTLVEIMNIEFPFVNVPPEAREVVGEATPGTRFYRREGSDEDCAGWFEGLMELFKGDVGLSPGGAVMFVPVSRAAVHKRLREGRLTGFAYYVTSQGKSLWGKPRKVKEAPYLVLSVSECKAWAKELKRKAGVAEEAELNRDQRGELLGSVAVSDEPGSLEEVKEDTRFVEQDPKDKGRKGMVYGGAITREEIIELIQTQVLSAVEAALGKLLPGKLGDEHRRRGRGGMLVEDSKSKELKGKD
jgi:hypothetical protein